MNKLSFEKRVQVLSALVEGCSIAVTCRMTGVAKMTVLKLLCDVGEACSELHDRWFRDIPATRIECDEIWSFVGMKQKNVPADLRGTFGVGDRLDVHYESERDGWVIEQASRFGWSVNDEVCDSDWQEVAFVQAWARAETAEEEQRRIDATDNPPR